MHRQKTSTTSDSSLPESCWKRDRDALLVVLFLAGAGVLIGVLIATNIIPIHSSSSSCPVGSLCKYGGQGANASAIDYSGGVLTNAAANPSDISTCLSSSSGLIPTKRWSDNAIDPNSVLNWDLNAYAFSTSVSLATNCNELCCYTPGCVEASIDISGDVYPDGRQQYGATSLGNPDNPIAPGSTSYKYPCILRRPIGLDGTPAFPVMDTFNLTYSSTYFSRPTTTISGHNQVFTPSCTQGFLGITPNQYLYQSTPLQSSQIYHYYDYGDSDTMANACIAKCASKFIANSFACYATSFGNYGSDAINVTYSPNDTLQSLQTSTQAQTGSNWPYTFCVLFGANYTTVPWTGTSQFSQVMLPNVFGQTSCTNTATLN